MIGKGLAAAAAFLTLCGAGSGQGSVFPVSYWYPAGSSPTGCVLRDLNHDNVLDFLVANYTADNVSVYLGAGGGLRNPLSPVQVGGTPRTLAVADMNGDTHPDLLALLSSAGQVAVLLGDGLGGFGAPTLFATGAFPVAIDVGDLNADGKLDVVTGDQADNGLSVLLGNGLGGLGAPTAFFTGFAPEHIRLADMDGNGSLDCVAACWLDNRVTVSLGDGNGNLSLSGGGGVSTPKGLDVGDLNADGRPDVVVASSQTDSVSVFLNNGGGGLLPPQVHWLRAAADYPTTALLADANGDGRDDIITCEAGSRTITVLVNVGGGEFDFAHTSPVIEAAYNGVSADLNGDGLADVVTSHQIEGSLRVHLGDGTGSWELYCTPKTNSLGCAPRIEAVGTPSVTNARPFTVVVTNVLNSKPGMFLYTVNGGHLATPFQGGTLCLGPTPIRRTPGMGSGGEVFPPQNCTGSYALDFNAFAQGLAGGTPAPGLLVLGNSYQLQAWSRDNGFPFPNNTGLSAALDVTPRL
ncbi:MAG: VCBS repeat-containing protein [Planctomycetes bacterium]|nr:VCBS repeat-containing protein [Planctomycetota bacterium]